MTADEVLLDLYTRLTSRKFVSFLLVIVFAIWNWHAGRLTDIEFQVALTAAFTAYGFIEGATDFAANLPRPTVSKAPLAEVKVGNTEVNTDLPADPAPAPPRVRPSRARPKAPPRPPASTNPNA